MGEVAGEEFYKYMIKHKIPSLKSSILRDVREKAGFVNGERAFTNVSESWNALIKRLLACNRKTSFYRLLSGLVDIFDVEQEEVYHAYSNRNSSVRKATKQALGTASAHKFTNKVCVLISENNSLGTAV